MKDEKVYDSAVSAAVYGIDEEPVHKHSPKKNKVFDLSSISIIACDCLQAIICIFIDSFFVSKILNSGGDTASNIISIGLFYLIYYLVLASSYSVSGFVLKKIKKSIFVSIGAVILTLSVFLVYLLSKGSNLTSFVPLVAVVYGIGFAFFSSGFNNLTAETISSKHQVKFFAVKRIMYQLIYIIFPVTLGLIIDNIDFSFVALIMLGVCALLIVFSFLIRPKKTYHLEFKVPSFAKYLKQHKEETKPLFLVYVTNFFRGASYDCFTTLITILVICTFGSNTSLGTFQSIFTALSLVTLFFYLRYYRKKRATKFIIPVVVLVTITIICILSVTNEVTVLLFYAVYAILNVILMSVSDSRRSGVIRVLSLHDHILESNAIAEFFLGAGRIVSTLFLILAGVFDSLVGGSSTIFLQIAIGLVCMMYVMYGVSLVWLEKALIKQDDAFKSAHANERIRKNED